MTHHFLFAILAAATATSALAQAAAPALPRATFIATMDGEYKKIDANRDGQVTRAEVEAFQKGSIAAQVAARQRAMFVALDTDKNGALSQAEFARVPVTPPRTNPDLIMRFDTGKDGRVSLIEHRTATLANFDRIDTDKDGVVSAAEMAAGGVRR